MRTIALVMLTAALNSTAAAAVCTATSGERRVALLELYTSEGCDSCPPADRWVSSLPSRGLGSDRLVVLGFHVDYWNHLGWPDPFAQKRFSERQRALGTRNGARFVYTPQLLLDGKDYRRGIFRDDFAERVAAINQRPPRAGIRLQLRRVSGNNLVVDGSVTVHGTAPSNEAQTYLALYENNLANRVSAGENRGKQLQHDFVVRELIGPVPISARGTTEFSRTFRLDPRWKSADLVVTAFVQGSTSGDLLQAVAAPHCD
ncbi:MAG: hypothetical protein A3G24_03460 [Betaproteobacteria bacterium RIFCSPLOWO2_12_FULL_62_13]|nr:MAG: hypothetical protein A3G24_03460 [Betaproteobacteria bacterium RIFCSPLOWO2_12_FULL_62_13]